VRQADADLDRALITAVVGVARQLGMRTVAGTSTGARWWRTCAHSASTTAGLPARPPWPLATLVD
jgi:hypothetical protein